MLFLVIFLKKLFVHLNFLLGMKMDSVVKIEISNINVNIGSHRLPYVWYSSCSLVLVVSNSASTCLGPAV